MSNLTELPDLDLPATTDAAREYLVAWHRENLTHAPYFADYISNTLAGDFAFHLARWLAHRAQTEGYRISASDAGVLVPLSKDSELVWIEGEGAVPLCRCKHVQPEGEAPQADRWHSLTCDGTCSPPCKDAPAAQHAESGAQSVEEAFEKHRIEQGRIIGMPGLAARPSFIAGWQAALAAQSQGAQAAPGDIALLGALAQAADVFMSGGVAPLRPLIERAKARAALAAKAEAPAPEWGRVRTVGDMVRNLLTLDQADPIHSAFFVDFDGKRRCRTSHISVSRERVIDGKLVDQTRKDVPYAIVVWAKPDERAQQAAGPGATIDTPEFCDLITELDAAHEEVGAARSKKAWAALVAHIDARIAAATSAPGTPEAPILSEEMIKLWVKGYYRDSRNGKQKSSDVLAVLLRQVYDYGAKSGRAAQLDGGQGEGEKA